eukprot:CAMPEP_0113935562 /NCGR_PEP_ID=MMETSP1339-20121228/2702_1 /TAXON_ID=94617 /ORGANISM="Fibrocapsa japonica" /LENGTH=306 /DNA_ID=CAMNT_0000937771 /DNA_START=97 /DNA_END=1017 /DNA_ORIENTATION=+ /assembly_acc=CAM_ASM_000762
MHVVSFMFMLFSARRTLPTPFAEITRMQQECGKPWGKFLDAGTGLHSMKWVSSRGRSGGLDSNEDPVGGLESWCGVTASWEDAQKIRQDPQVSGVMQDSDSVVLGNWDDPDLLKGMTFDTVLADYLIGAMDGFSPYKQDLMLPRLKQHMAPGARLYIIGLEPLPDKSQNPAEDIVCEVRRVRDACILLAGHRCYREFPLEWTERHLTGSGFRVVESKKLPIMYSFQSIKRQIDVASRKLPFFKDKALVSVMRQHIDQLTERVREAVSSTPNSRVRLGFDYIISAEVSETSENIQAGPPVCFDVSQT